VYVRRRFISRLETKSYLTGEQVLIKLDQSETLKTLSEQMWMRWVFLTLATVLPAIKLIFGLGGVPWAASWGAMYLLSIIMTETLVLFGSRALESEDRTGAHDPASEELMAPDSTDARDTGPPTAMVTPWLKAMHKFSDDVEKDLAFVGFWVTLSACMVHFGLLIWAAWDLKPELGRDWREIGKRTILETFYMIVTFLAALCIFPFAYGAMILLYVPLSPILLLLWVCGYKDFVTWAYDYESRDTVTMFVHLGVMLIAYIGTFLGILRWFLTDQEGLFKQSLLDIAFLLGMFSPWLLSNLLEELCSLVSCKFGRRLSLIEKCHCEDELEDGQRRPKCEADAGTCFLASLFFVDFVLLFLWYPIRYNSTGTYVSSWPSALLGN
jgi:hypothetical protein